jgi:adenosine deaminase
MQDAAQQGLDYVELRFSPGYMGMTHQLPLEGVVEAVIAGVKEGSQAYGVKANLIGIMSRTFGQEACEKELNALLAHKNDIKALDLAGDELGFPGNLFIDHFKKHVMQVGRLPYMQAKLLAQKVFGKPLKN